MEAGYGVGLATGRSEFTVKATVEVTLKDGSKKVYAKEVEIDVRDGGVKPENKRWPFSARGYR